MTIHHHRTAHCALRTAHCALRAAHYALRITHYAATNTSDIPRRPLMLAFQNENEPPLTSRHGARCRARLWRSASLTNRRGTSRRDSGFGVGEIAYRCGFQTPFHFSRWVRATESRSPREVRTQVWTGRGPSSS